MKRIGTSLVIRNLLVLLLVAASVTGCATPYKAFGIMGGYEDLKLDDNTYHVSYRNNTASQRTINLYNLYRCAELTIEKGYDYFIITDALDESQKVKIDDMSGSIHAVSRTIDLHRGSKPADNPTAYDARELLKNLDKEVSR